MPLYTDASQYGSTFQYAKKLSEQTNIPAVNYKEIPDLSAMHTIIYMGGLYAGGVLGLAKTLMALLYRSLRKTPLEQQAPEDRALIETYGKQVDFINFSALEPIIQEIQRK